MISAIATLVLAQSASFTPLADPSTDLARTTLGNLQGSVDPVKSSTKMQPFLTGYYYWRMQTLGTMPFSTIEKSQMSVCALVLNLYVPGTSDAWKPFADAIADKPVTELPDDADEYLRITLRKKIFEPYFSITGTKPEASPKEIEEFFIAVTLGELSAAMSVYNTTKGHDYPQGMLADGIINLKERLKDSKADPYTPAVRQKLEALTHVAQGEKLNQQEYPTFEKAFREAVMSIADLAKD